MKKAIALTLALVLCLALCACGGSSAPAEPSAPAAPSAPSTPAAPSEPAAPSQEPEEREYIELVFQNHDPVTSTSGIFYQQWCDDIYAESDGKLNIVLYAGGTLGGQKDTYNMILNGACDLGWCSQNSQQGAFPVTELFSLPLLGFESVQQSSRTLWHLYEDTDFMKKEYEPFHVITIHTYCDIPLGFAKAGVQINTVDDLKNMSVRTSGTWPSAFFTSLGANPVTISASEVYSSLEKGVVDATSCDWHLIKSFSLTEQLRTVYDTKLIYGCDYLCMNKDVWDSLPAWAQEIINNHSGLALCEAAADAWDENRDLGISQLKEHGYEFIEPSAELMDGLNAAAQALHEEWKETNDAAGYPATDAYNWVMEHMDEYK